jgi:hypothetical protein
MNLNLQKDNYFIVEGFLHPQMSTYIGTEFKKHCISTMAKSDVYVPGSPAVYGHPLISQMLVSKIFFMNDLIGERLYPTYCYARWYKKGAELKKHIDAEPCEISVTLNLGGDLWPIYFTKPDGSTTSATLKPGDAVIYNGIKSEHWREPFNGNECVQAFLHYVTVNGPNYFHAFDSQRTANGQV